MRNKLPDETGWYWAYSHGSMAWLMVFVDCGLREKVVVFDGDNGACECRLPYDDEAIRRECGKLEWYAKIGCPGGDFQSETVIISQEVRDNAAAAKKAIVVKHVDYSFCDRPHGGSVTIVGQYDASEAEALLFRA